ncbi:MAG: RNA polymerase-binding protein DksA [Candidatus Binatia bacterium]|nr:RNA polymerase-binding protein DksA [Candidatus Binatia bacterium]
MTAHELVYFRELLEERKEQLIGEAGRTAHDMGDNEAEGFPDPTDRGVMESERNLELRIRDRERKLISKIDEAMERIEQGSFGLCEECEEPIGAKRLQVRPVTTLCIRCKEEQEQAEKSASSR